MITYIDYLKHIDGILDEEEFNEIISNLPPIEKFPEDFYVELDDDFESQLINECILSDYRSAVTEAIDIDSKRIWIYDIESLKDLEKIKALFEKYGWTLETYEKEKQALEEAEETAKMIDKTSPILYMLQNVENIEEFKSKLKDAYEESLNW